ncbi:YczE/YyaS/YitT family protein [Bacillus sp. FJAT-44742]|uniref:YczE/YyaS/YitT family protein n=1 Tax=Bacillus sp. FJAT-44742 TaxID=2014005 RepID=UPI000C23B055|nr:YitT family protein [Bacillus sp. FJAT-44742]
MEGIMGKAQLLTLRWLIFMIGLIIMSFGIALMIRAELGSAPWDVLHIGLTLQLGLTVGTWSIIIGIFIIGFTSLLTKERPQLGGIVNMVLVGVFIDVFLFVLPAGGTFLWQLLMLLGGIIVIAYGIGLYIAPNCGAGPRDSLMLALTQKTGWKVSRVRGIMEIVVLTVGWLLGGPVFLGTILFCFGIGAVVGITLPQCQQFVDRLIKRGGMDENFNKGTIRADHYDGAGKEVR